jgi:hypothetical protein
MRTRGGDTEMDEKDEMDEMDEKEDRGVMDEKEDRGVMEIGVDGDEF